MSLGLRHCVRFCMEANVCTLLDMWQHILSCGLDRDAMDYFRAIVKAGERSQRGLELTDHLIQLNPAHYTVW
jgi:hypothetical protein